MVQSRAMKSRIPILVITSLWVLFFWRVWAGQLTFAEGDFSGQFVAWTDYAVERLDAGEIPLWNPYQYGGAPFQASSQTALTYPPRMVTLGTLLLQSEVTIHEVYGAIQIEAMLHVWFAMLALYFFVWRYTASRFGALFAALTFGFGGYLTGYPILQVPLLEAAVWLPLVLLGILEATRTDEVVWKRILYAGLALGLCLLAGHPQTALFTIYIAIAFLAYRTRQWRNWLLGVLLLGLVSSTIAAVQLLPTAEFTLETSRTGLTFEDKGGGYRFEQMIDVLLPIRGQIWVATYFGLVSLAAVGIAIWKRVPDWGLWLTVLVVAFLLSFGSRLPLYGVIYPLLPGLSLFRGQERATFLIAYSFAILAGLGAAHLTLQERDQQTLRRVLMGFLVFSMGFVVLIYVLAQTNQRSEVLLDRLDGAATSALILGAMLVGLRWFFQNPSQPQRQIAIIALLIFDLFSASFMLNQNYDPINLDERPTLQPFVPTMRDNTDIGERVDGLRGIWEGYSTTYRLPDIHGSDPLQLDAARYYLEELPRELRWELLSVALVNSDESELPIPAQELTQATDQNGTFSIWRLEDPRAFAHAVYDFQIVEDDEQARERIQLVDTRESIILDEPPSIDIEMPENPESRIDIVQFDPENIVINAELSDPAVLSLSLMDYPGWQATINGEETEMLRAYGGLSAIAVPSGTHQITLNFTSHLLPVGAVISGVAWLFIVLIAIFWRRR